MFSVVPVAVGSGCNASARLGCTLLYFCVDLFQRVSCQGVVLYLHLKHFMAALIKRGSSEHLVIQCPFICLLKWYRSFAAYFMKMSWTHMHLSVAFFPQ